MTVPRPVIRKKLSTMAACCSVVPMSLAPGHMVSTASNTTAPPIMQQAPPAVQQAPPAVDQAPPAVQQAPPAVQQAPPAVDQAYPAFDPPESASPLTTSESSTAAVGIPALLGALLVGVLRKGRRAVPGECPECGSAALANVGSVGAYRECYRCHNCGSLWNPAG